MDTVSIQKTYAGKHVLVTGASGFMGKVWLSMVLDRVPNIGRIYVLLRKKGLRPVRDRFEKMVGSSHCFKPLHDKHGKDFGAYLSERVEIVDGDVSAKDFGIEAETLKRLRRDVDLVINCAGLVDFAPDVRDSLGSNVDGAVHAADLVQSCDHAALLHVSTCYVTGTRGGVIEEKLITDESPNGKPFDIWAEYDALKETIASIEASVDSPESQKEIRDSALERIRSRGLDENNTTLVRNMMHRQRNQSLKQKMADAGKDHAAALGFPNTYTMTKFMAEAALGTYGDKLRWTTLRPAVVESAISFPFEGWNEGFNTCGPLLYLLETWFRHLPCKADNPFDVIPVDMVCNMLTIVGAGLMLNRYSTVYHCGSSDKNQFNMGRATELSALGTRKYLRKHGDSAVDRLVRSRFDATSAEPDYWFSMKNVGSAAKGIGKLLRKLPESAPKVVRDKAEDFAVFADGASRQANQINDVLELFQPFIYDNFFVFECRNIDQLPVEEEEFAFSPESIVWRDYWIDIHMPGIRRWSFPVIEGRQPESYKSDVPFVMVDPVSVEAPVTEKRVAAYGEGG